MSWNFHAQRHGARVGHFAQEIHGRFSVPLFQFAIGSTHAAESLDAAGVALALPRFLLAAHATEKIIPAGAKTTGAPVVAFLVGKHTDADLAVRVQSGRGQARRHMINNSLK